MSAANPSPHPEHPYASPSLAAHAQEPVVPGTGDATGGVIPYKNPAALIAYYVGICALFPIIGLPLGVIAFVLGIKGLRDRSRRPEIKGSVHAWIGIVLGVGASIMWGLVVAFLGFAYIAR